MERELNTTQDHHPHYTPPHYTPPSPPAPTHTRTIRQRHVQHEELVHDQGTATRDLLLLAILPGLRRLQPQHAGDAPWRRHHGERVRAWCRARVTILLYWLQRALAS